MAAVWPNQFITDSALNKQIARLRNALDSQDASESFVQALRGVGMRLIVDVQIIDNPQHVQHNSVAKRVYPKYMIAAGVFLVVNFLLFWLFNQPNQFSQPNLVATLKHDAKTSEPIKPSKQSISVAIVPAQKTDEWLDIGGLNYLS